MGRRVLHTWLIRGEQPACSPESSAPAGAGRHAAAHAALVSLLQSWIDEEDDAGEQQETGEYLVRALDEARLPGRQVAPDRAQGRHLVSLVVALEAGPLGLVTNPKRSPESLAAPSGFRRTSQPVRVSSCEAR